ncbi:MAG: TetR/AcrR family transcriptional regulator [Solobacterium sp.]|nr:TetR/AcrR family transcriptional regulator [Solobacterium sp.]MBQ6531641.1 TetR/AcrR family transcriptional regulator [Solobacterium sp.]
MAPRIRINENMIVNAALEVIRQAGFDNVNARTVAARLGCSTQPVMYHFATMDSLKRAAYTEADQLHTAYLMNIPQDKNPVLGIGLNYIRFAVEEPQLFRFLFHSGYGRESSLMEMVNAAELDPVLSVMQEELGADLETTREVFMIVALFAHGYASILAGNALEYDEAQIAEHLERVWNGAVFTAEKGKKE